MHFRIFSVLTALLVTVAFVFAQETAPEKVKKTAAAAATPAPAKKTASASAKATATPAPDAPKKRSFMSRFFGKKTKEEAPAATPTPTPRPRRPRPKPPTDPQATTDQPANKTTEKSAEPPAPKTEENKPDATAEKPEPKAEPKTEPKAQPKTEPEPPKATTKKGAGKGKVATSTPAPTQTKEQQALAKAHASGDADTIEKAKYDEVKSRAAADEKVAALKQKAEAAPTDEEGRKDLRAYNKALFQKMRALDPSLKARIDRMEAAVLKQLGDE
jgi:hypothetical protein